MIDLLMFITFVHIYARTLLGVLQEIRCYSLQIKKANHEFHLADKSMFLDLEFVEQDLLSYLQYVESRQSQGVK